MKSLKTAAFFEAWINEKTENFLFETYNVRPGEIRVKLENANWLLYSCYELAELLGHREISKGLRKLRIRVKNGIKEELLILLKLKGVGRVRARKLYNNGIKTLSDLKRIDSSSLSLLLGKKLATKVKSVLGEDIKEVPKGKRTGQLSLEKF
jgi:helicase